ncbi:hypothetical protein ACFRI7_15550 [Streptomyces sp. NPDC056716]|uniref:hypothetical protein n=1 Tax=unclassified Streptomyces TaxID=2593676 RepID=UPI0036B02441
MTRSLIRGRPRRAKAHISARLAQSVVGVVIAVLWLGLALHGTRDQAPATPGAGPAAQQDGTSAADLALPLVVAVGAVVAGTYGYLRRTHRRTGRTTPAAPASATPLLPPLDDRARALLVAADDSVRASREELDFAAAGWDERTAAPFRHALRHAETELSAAFAIRERYDDGVPQEDGARRQALTGIAGRCEEAGRVLDAQAPALDAARRLESDLAPALERAETRFRDLTARVIPAERTLTDLAHRHGPGALAPVAGFVEQARDRLVFAALRLNQSHQRSDLGEPDPAAAELRAAEGAVAQAAVLLDAVTGLARDLTAADALLPTALTEAETESEAAVTPVRRDLVAKTPHDPLALLRRALLSTNDRSAALTAAASLLARSTTATTDAYITTHRAAISATPRTHLATAFRLLTTNPAEADTKARLSRDLAEQDVRTHGNPYADESVHAAGVAGAVLGGILLDQEETGGPPSSYGGPGTRARRVS